MSSSTPIAGGLTKLKVGELRERLAEQGLSTAGTKPVLVARLREALQGSSPSIVATPSKAEDTPGPARRSKRISESQAEFTGAETPVKKIKQETSRASTPVRRSRRLSGSLDCPAIDNPGQEKSSIETIAEDTEEIQPEAEVNSVEGQSKQKEKVVSEETNATPAEKPQANKETERPEQEIQAEPEPEPEVKIVEEQPEQKETVAPAEKAEANEEEKSVPLEKSEQKEMVVSEVTEAPAEKENIPLEKMLDQVFASKSIPRQKPKSGRFWKGERAQFRQIKRDRGQRPTFEQRLKLKEEKMRNQELAELMKNRKKQEKEELRKRIEENKAKKLENERKTEQYQLIKNPAKLKRMKKKQLRMLEKRDILPTK